MMKKRTIVETVLIITVLVIAFVLFGLRFMHPDMTDMRFFVTYWYLHVPMIILALLNLVNWGEF